ncbi:uncharacterized protein B0H18DRAFT_316448 [Fomitopsis serialis]|uniref:uncharacterized protein n=1 Tax=Fomitopsis serialis TaxID=139415 RepID=UPI002008379F|nr:uncharacterized protein B0H18DRAFT_316448 [Neoantrodia serialis]KAH9936204.1 hypothetical protein B0H18DRAFT_316448 [Neoantrodia serialis]
MFASDQDIVPSSQDDERVCGLRTSHSAAEVAPTSDRLDLLRRACNGLKEDGSQLPINAINEAEDMLDDMYNILKRLRRRVGGEGRSATR